MAMVEALQAGDKGDIYESVQNTFNGVLFSTSFLMRVWFFRKPGEQ
jgi:hypothetical protein